MTSSRPDERSSAADVAIIGMACIFPGAPDLETYWQNITGKVDAVGEPPADWGAGLVLEPGSTASDVLYCTRGGYLRDLARFNPLEYGIMPRSVDGGEPDHFLAIRVAHEALADAGYLGRALDGERTEVVLGRGTYVNRGYTAVVQHAMMIDQTLAVVKRLHPEHTGEELVELRRELSRDLPPFNAEIAPGLVPNILSGRIANRLDFMGPNFTVDAACASALIALDIAMRDLATGKCDMAVVGGVHVSTPFPIHMIFCQLGALSRRGEIRPFDRSADGTIMGEGLGMVVLKRRADAERDGDRIYAVVKAVGTASDGRALGLLAPRLEGEILALRRAYEASGVPPQSVGLIEAHGTATPVGDATEIEALGRVFGPRNGEPPWCAIGSVKSMIGHTLPAAGIAGLIKAALALYHKVLPPTLHCDEPDPRLGLDRTPLYVNTETRPWIHRAGDPPRRAGVNAFGFGGINAHAILEEHAAPTGLPTPSLQRRWDSEVLIVEGRSRAELIEEVAKLRAYLVERPDVALVDVAYTCNVERRPPGAPGARLAIIASTPREGAAKLEHALGRLAEPGVRRIRDISGIYFFAEPLGRAGKVGFMFPGEGSQYVGMLGDLCMHFPEVRAWFDLMDRAVSARGRADLPSQVIFPPPGGAGADDPERDERQLWRMDIGAEAVFTASQALLTLLGRLDLRPDAVVGHSTGEYSALLASGAIRVDDENQLVAHVAGINAIYERLAAEDAIPHAVLVTVGGAPAALVAAVVDESAGAVQVAMDNCPHQLVLAATAAAAPEAVERLRRGGALCTMLPFNRAYHTPSFEPMGNALRGFFGELHIGPAAVPLYSCVTAGRYPEDPDEIRRLAAIQWSHRVRFRETIEAMHDEGVRIFVEVGPRHTLTGFVDDILKRRSHLAVSTNVPRRSGITQLNHLVGMLVAHHVPMRLDHLYAHRSPRALSFDAASDGAEQAARDRRLMKIELGLAPLALPAARPAPAPPRPSRPADNGHETPEAPARPLAPPVASADRVTAAGVTPSESRREASPSPAAHAMRAYLDTMDEFLATQEDVVRGFLARRTTAPHMPAPPQRVSAPATAGAPAFAGPWSPSSGRLVSHVPGQHLVVLRDVSPDDETFLRDHTLGGRVSADDPALTGLPVMPLTMSMELMAQAAAALEPGRLLVGMRDVRAHRWMAFEIDRVGLRLEARRVAAGEIRVDVREQSEASPNPAVMGPPIVEAVMVFADRYPSPPLAEPLALDAERPSAWTPDRLYGGLMFHGPRFQGVASMDRWGRNGAEATLRALPDDALFRSTPAPPFLADPVVLDAAGQVIGYWIADGAAQGAHVFPYRLDSLALYGPRLEPPARVACRARIAPLGDDRLRSDIDVVGPDGRVHARLVGWEDKRFDLPAPLYQLRVAPALGRMSEPWSAPLARARDASGLACARMDAPAGDLLDSGGGVWRRVLAHLVLSRSERAVFMELDRSPARRDEWLLARVAAKDVIRDLVSSRGGGDVLPADVEIAADAHGRPEARGNWVRSIGEAPLVSLAHSSGVAAAIAGDAGNFRGIGIDIEPVDRALGSDVARVAFGPVEHLALSELSAVDRHEWVLRCWCAKEALAKALGRGLMGRPLDLSIQSVERDSGRVWLSVGGTVASEVPWAAGRRFESLTTRTGRWIAAICLIERGV